MAFAEPISLGGFMVLIRLRKSQEGLFATNTYSAPRPALQRWMYSHAPRRASVRIIKKTLDRPGRFAGTFRLAKSPEWISVRSVAASAAACGLF